MGKKVSATVATATVPAIVASQGAHIAISPVDHTANAGKYREAAKHVPCATQLFTLANADAVTFGRTGRNKAGKYTVAALLCYAAAKAGATLEKPVSGFAIVQLMQTDPDILEAYKSCRAVKYAGGGAIPCAHWASEYVTGFARGIQQLLKRVAA